MRYAAVLPRFVAGACAHADGGGDGTGMGKDLDYHRDASRGTVGVEKLNGHGYVKATSGYLMCLRPVLGRKERITLLTEGMPNIMVNHNDPRTKIPRTKIAIIATDQ
jgi:hypothetical protein